MKGTKRFAFSDKDTSDFGNKRIMAGSLFDSQRAEPSQQQSMATPSLDVHRAEASRQHVRALNSQFASWVQTQLKNHPDELWEDGARDYLAHTSNIMEKFSDVVKWLKANALKGGKLSPGESDALEKKLVPNIQNNDAKLSQEKAIFSPSGSTTTFGISWSSGGVPNNQSSGVSSHQSGGIPNKQSTVLTNNQSGPKFSASSNNQPDTQSSLFNNNQSSPQSNTVNNNQSGTRSSQFNNMQTGTQSSISKNSSPSPFSNNQSSVFSNNQASVFSSNQPGGLSNNQPGSFSNNQTSIFSNSQAPGLFSSAQTSLCGNQSSATTNVTTNNNADDVDGEEDLPQPSSPSVKKSEEKGIVVVHEVKCKLYVKSSDPADKDTWKDKGTGQLCIKCKEGINKGTKESKPTIVVRNDVGKVLLNALLYPGIKTNAQKNSIVAIFHTASDDGASNDSVVARTFLIRMKSADDRNKLATAIQDYAPAL